MHEGKSQLLASITRYTLTEINGRKVLMRDDALRAFREVKAVWNPPRNLLPTKSYQIAHIR